MSTRAFPSSSLSSTGSSGSTGGAGLTLESVLASSDTPSDLLKTRSTREKKLYDRVNNGIVSATGVEFDHVRVGICDFETGADECTINKDRSDFLELSF